MHRVEITLLNKLSFQEMVLDFKEGDTLKTLVGPLPNKDVFVRISKPIAIIEQSEADVDKMAETIITNVNFQTDQIFAKDVNTTGAPEMLYTYQEKRLDVNFKVHIKAGDKLYFFRIEEPKVTSTKIKGISDGSLWLLVSML